MAGHDTTASVLSFLAYDLALAPEIQDRVVAEIAEVLPDKVRNVVGNMWDISAENFSVIFGYWKPHMECGIPMNDWVDTLRLEQIG